MTKREIKLIAIDLDGTLLNSQHEMSTRNEKAIQSALAKGVKVIFATGKTYTAAEWIYKKLGLTSPGVFNQGTAIYSADGSLRSQLVIESRVVRQVITYAEDRGYLTGLYCGRRIVVRAAHPRIAQLTVDYHEPQPEVVGPLQNLLDTVSVNKILFFAPGDARRITALRWQLGLQLNGGGELLFSGTPDMLEVLPPKSSKGAGVKQLAKDLGISMNQVMALGDAENDLEMLEMAGWGVAMGNANDHLKGVADAVTSTNDQDGVAEAIEKYVLAEEAEVKAESVIAAVPAAGS